MKMRHSLLVIALAAFASAASAHDPSEFEGFNSHAAAMPAAPTTCEELDNVPESERDLTDPDIKALQEKCSASDEGSEAEAKES